MNRWNHLDFLGEGKNGASKLVPMHCKKEEIILMEKSVKSRFGNHTYCKLVIDVFRYISSSKNENLILLVHSLFPLCA